MGDALPGVGELLRYLMSCTDSGVREVEVVRLGEAVELERQLRVVVSRAVEVNTEAMLCRLVLNLRERPAAPVDRVRGLKLLAAPRRR